MNKNGFRTWEPFAIQASFKTVSLYPIWEYSQAEEDLFPIRTLLLTPQYKNAFTKAPGSLSTAALSIVWLGPGW